MVFDCTHSVRVKNGAGWRQYGRVRLMISVGKEYHERSKLQAVVNWINRNVGISGNGSGIQEVHVSVNDFLQRHNYMAAGLEEKAAGRAALQAGDQWLERNKETLSAIKVPTRFTRWNEWFFTPDFDYVYVSILDYASRDAAFEEAIHTDSTALARRKEARCEEVPPALIRHSMNYVREELAIFAIQSTTMPAAEVYPGSNLASANYLIGRELPILMRPLAHRHFTRIDFDRIQPTCHNILLQQLKIA